MAAPVGGINVPGDDGFLIDGYDHVGLQIYLLGGQTNAHVDRTVTFKLQVSDDLMLGAVRQWVDIVAGYDLGTDATAASWSSVGLTPLHAAIDLENCLHKRVRGNYTYDAAPEVDHPGGVIVMSRLR